MMLYEMILCLLIIFYCFCITEQTHFNGGTITWVALPPYNATSPVTVSITQTYSWTYPYVSCAKNVPTSTSRFSGANTNLTCTVGCSTDGGYSTHPIDILTDCTSASASLGMLSSTKTKNVTLSAGANFYVAYLGTAWRALGPSNKGGAEWSILTYINLQLRPDGVINTPPVAQVVSPQYAFVNETVQIQIPVSDVNQGDDVRCRWATYTSGYRRRKRSGNNEYITQPPDSQLYSTTDNSKHRRNKRSFASWTWGTWGTWGTMPTMASMTTDSDGCNDNCGTNSCNKWCNCGCNRCDSSTCNNNDCNSSSGCTIVTTAIITTTTTSVTTTTTVTTTTSTSTTSTKTTTATTDTSTAATTTTVSSTETLGTLRSTSSYPVRQAINECGDICFPSSGSVPNTTTLVNCTLTFTGTKAGVWYAVAIQVEDFINSTSTTPMSSIPVQLLIYVLPQPKCSQKPIILPVNGCLEVEVRVTVNFTIYVTNLCNQTIAVVNSMIISTDAQIYTTGNLTNSTTNSSISYVNINWIPQANEIGNLEFCFTAYTSENLASNESCVTFTVKNSSDLCVTTTTSTTSTTSTTTSDTTTTTSTTSTSETTSTATTTSTTSITSTTTSDTTMTTSTTSTSETTSTTTSTTSTSTTSTTSTSSTSTSTTSTTTSTTTTSVTTTTTTTTTATTVTTTTAVVKSSKPEINWLLIMGLSLLALLLAICCACCCLYCCLWGPGARRRRRRRRDSSHAQEQHPVITRSTLDIIRKRCSIGRKYEASALSKTSLIDTTSRTNTSPTDLLMRTSDSATTITRIDENRISSTVFVQKLKRSDIENMNNIKKVGEPKDTNDNNVDNGNNSLNQQPPVTVLCMNRLPNLDETNKRKSSAVRLQSSSDTLAKTSKVTQVKFKRIGRRRASTAGNISMIELDKSSFELGTMGNRFNSSIETTNGRMNATNMVAVKKLPRKLMNIHSAS